jgi:hypothetical protein
MRVIAKRGNEVYLILADDNPGALEQPRPAARVLDLEQGILTRPMNAHSILARGYWEPAEISTEELRELLEQPYRVDGPDVNAPWVLPPLPLPTPSG